MSFLRSVQAYATYSRLPFFALAEKYLHPQSVVLDVGAGEASFAQSLQRTDIYMLDGNPATVDALSKTYPHVSLGNLPALPYPTQFFDMIHASHIVEHLSPETLYDFLKECDRCLKEGGYLVISAPLLSDIFYDDLSHIKPYSPAVFKKYLTRKDANNYTRPPVSQKYEVREEVYRFIELPFDLYRFFIHNKLINTLYYRWQRFCYNIGFRRYVKNGFTLILQKTK